MNPQSRLTWVAFLSLMVLTPFMAFLANVSESPSADVLPSYTAYAAVGLLATAALFWIAILASKKRERTQF